jgi:hypothetical protein
MTDTVENPFTIKLVAQSDPSNKFNRVVFKVTPDLSEAQTVNYSTIEPVHMPGQIFVYKNTTSRTFSLSNIRLISRTADEADLNLRYLWTLRGWTKPRFGINSKTLLPQQIAEREKNRLSPERPEFASAADRAQKLGVELLGSPPETLLFSAYSSGKTGTAQRMEHIRRVPVVIQSLNVPYPSDVDYIISTSGVPMPTIMSLDVTLLETHSPREYEKFSLDDYRNGILPNF